MKTAHPDSSLERVCFSALLLVLVWAPLPFASNRDWSAALLALLVLALLTLWLLVYLAGRIAAPDLQRSARLALALLACVQAWVLLQTLPLPRALVQLLSPQALAWQPGEGWLPLSLDVAATRHYLLVGLAITGAFFLTLALVNSQQRLRLLLMTLVLGGTLQAAYGAFMVLSGLEYGFLVEKYAGQGVATGTFVNRNHLAGYLVMCLACGIGLLLSQMRLAQYSSWRERLQGYLALLLSPRFRLRVYLAIMVIALVLTRSRSGNVIFFVALAGSGLVAIWAGRQLSWRLVALLGSLFVVDLLILGRWFGFDKLVARLEAMEGQQLVEIPRYWMDRYSLDYIGSFPLTGSGAGSFYGVFPNFQGAQVRGFVEHAHNDYLEFAAELGVPAALALGAVVLLALWQGLRAQRERRTPLCRGAGFAVVMTVTWAALHALTDFNLQVPANAITFAVILALGWQARYLPATTTSISARKT